MSVIINRFRFRMWGKNSEKMFYNIGVGTDDESTAVAELCKEDTSFYESDSVCIMQCTGRKDIEGRLLYQGDIVKTKSEKKWIIEYLFKDRYYLSSTEEGSDDGGDENQKGIPYRILLAVYCVECKYIGNIFETPELAPEQRINLAKDNLNE